MIEDDSAFAKVLYDFCKDKNFKCLHAPSGEDGLHILEQFEIKAIILDIKLPGMDGWQVLEILKNNQNYRHIPVHIISAESETFEAYNKGAVGYLSKPVEKNELNKVFEELEHFVDDKVRNLLIVEDDDIFRGEIKKIINAKDIKITESVTGEAALEEILGNRFDCVVLDLGLPDMSGFELLEKLEKAGARIPPVIVYTGRDITREENIMLQRYTNSVIIKGVKSQERLLDETALFLHRVVDKLPGKQRKMLSNLYDKDLMFKGKRVLLVDDDMRNIFALTHVLEQANLHVEMADNGKKALEKLDSSSFDLILMDIMMPVMDGYQAMKEIRNMPKFKNLPIIALTAKAMKDDREKCIAAGASDYLAKPVDVDRLMSLLRVWMYQ